MSLKPRAAKQQVCTPHSGGWESRVKVWAGRSLPWPLSWAGRRPSPPCVLTLSLCTCLCPHLSYEVTALGPTLVTSFYLTSLMTSSEVLGLKAPTYKFGGTQFRPSAY